MALTYCSGCFHFCRHTPSMLFSSPFPCLSLCFHPSPLSLGILFVVHTPLPYTLTPSHPSFLSFFTDFIVHVCFSTCTGTLRNLKRNQINHCILQTEHILEKEGGENILWTVLLNGEHLIWVFCLPFWMEYKSWAHKKKTIFSVSELFKEKCCFTSNSTFFYSYKCFPDKGIILEEKKQNKKINTHSQIQS